MKSNSNQSEFPGILVTRAAVSSSKDLALSEKPFKSNIVKNKTQNALLRALILCCCLFGAGTVNAQIITTVAGNGLTDPYIDGVIATEAGLKSPTGVAVDGSGNIFIADFRHHVIRKVTRATGIISTVAGNGTAGFSGDNVLATSTSLYNPYGVAVDGAGNLYIADYYNQRIRKVDAITRIITTVAGTGIRGFSGDGYPATRAMIGMPSRVVLDAAGNLYIADFFNQRIRKVTAATGVISTVAGNGVAGSDGDNGAATKASLNYPFSIALDGSGNLYIADFYNNRIRKVTAAGIISTAYGSDEGFAGEGEPATDALFNHPLDLTFDGSGNLYIADGFNHRIRKITASTGMINTVAGEGTAGFRGDNGLATAAWINRPLGIALDACGNIYIADEENSRIRKVEKLQVCAPAISPTPATGSLKIETNNAALNGRPATIRISPIPATEFLTIETNDAALNGRLATLTDIQGRIVQRFTISTGRQQISLAGLQAGVYILHIANGASYKVVKE